MLVTATTYSKKKTQQKLGKSYVFRLPDFFTVEKTCIHPFCSMNISFCNVVNEYLHLARILFEIKTINNYRIRVQCITWICIESFLMI